MSPRSAAVHLKSLESRDGATHADRVAWMEQRSGSYTSFAAMRILNGTMWGSRANRRSARTMTMRLNVTFARVPFSSSMNGAPHWSAWRSHEETDIHISFSPLEGLRPVVRCAARDGWV